MTAIINLTLWLLSSRIKLLYSGYSIAEAWSATVYQISQAHNSILRNEGERCQEDNREPMIWRRISQVLSLALKKCHSCQLCKRCHDMLIHVISKLSKEAAGWLHEGVLGVQINVCVHRLLVRQQNFRNWRLLKLSNGSKCADLWKCEKMLLRRMLKQKQDSTRTNISVKGFWWLMSTAITAGCRKTTKWIFD